MDRRIRKLIPIGAALAAIALALGPVAPATALGNNTNGCINGYSWRSADWSGGAHTYEANGCDPWQVWTRAQYQAYPGGPYYWTSSGYSSSSAVIYQSGTVLGEHSMTGAGPFYT
jgi:hypothetical protein